MLPSSKRSRAVACLGNGTPTRSKQRRLSDVVILSSSDVETDEARVPDMHGRVGSRGLFEQLQEDAFLDLKTDLRLELDRLHRIGEDDTLGSKVAATPSIGAPTRVLTSECPLIAEAEQDLREALRRWVGQHKSSRPTNHLLYRLDARFADNFSPGDRLVVETLGRFTAEVPFEAFLATLEREDIGRQEPTPSYLASAIRDSQSHLLISDIPVDERSWVHTKRSLPKQSSSVSATAVMLIPRDSVVDSLVECEVPSALTCRYCLQTTGVQRLVGYFTARISEPANRDRLLPVFREFCTKVWELDETRGLAVFPSDVVEGLLKALVLAQDWEFFDQALSKLGSYHLPTFFEWVADQVEAGLLAVRDIGTRLAATGLSSPIKFLRLRPPGNGTQLLLRQLAISALDGVGMQAGTVQDGQHLSELVYVVLGPEAVTLTLLPLVEKNPVLHTSFALGVFDGLRQVPTFHPSSPSVSRALLARFVRLFVDSLDVSKLCKPSPVSPTGGCRCCHLMPQPVHPGSVDATQLSSFVSGILAERIDDRILAVLALKIVRDVGLIKPREFAAFWLPFLRELLRILEENHVCLSAARYHHLFTAILEKYLDRCVGPPPVHWIPECQCVPCACRLCSLVNRFLRSSVRAASISLASDTEILHLNSWLLPHYANVIRCEFTVENGVVIIEKLMTIVQGPSFDLWTEKLNKATAEIDQLDRGQLRTVLGDSYNSIIRFDPVQPPRRSPVAIEELEIEMEESRPHPDKAGMDERMGPETSRCDGNWAAILVKRNSYPTEQRLLRYAHTPVRFQPNALAGRRIAFGFALGI
ncbi:hypothetical protein MFIFM68171_01682 [Madurella fahalii]|uniref:Uncharacterized protein n=1 Tax=Madurella fahalii TaxID=1157608 RepID=A0ABQ0G152_9PEZI